MAAMATASTVVALVEDSECTCTWGLELEPEPNWYGQVSYWCSRPGPPCSSWGDIGDLDKTDQLAAYITSETITRIRTADGGHRWQLRRVLHDTEKGEWSVEEVLQVKDLARMVDSRYFRTGSLGDGTTMWSDDDRQQIADPPREPGRPSIWKRVDGDSELKAVYGMTSLPAMEPPW
ncbi:hypothetical protein QBC46DRAFT_350819 [Diplogelasinospora grovesii]|uniref:Uncharacterized protein n=1 Tax=Diplogelasinospora grovesii TaxID=303347 RepID=A0AAN6S8V3_9PEZI|nr:hypothetical protein QBC46DRAFT_350819 [Diplogelasinospora grovesii]